MTGPEGSSEFCFPRSSVFPETKSRKTLRFEGNKIHCFPRDQSLSDLSYSKTKQKQILKNALTFLRQHQATFNCTHWSPATAINSLRVTEWTVPVWRHSFRNVAGSLHWETVSLLDVLWPWTSQWMAHSSGKNASYITIVIVYVKGGTRSGTCSILLLHISQAIFHVAVLVIWFKHLFQSYYLSFIFASNSLAIISV